MSPGKGGWCVPVAAVDSGYYSILYSSGCNFGQRPRSHPIYSTVNVERTRHNQRCKLPGAYV
jgi:hypothetical protein